MQLTIDSDEPLEHVLKALSALYQVDLTGAVARTSRQGGGAVVAAAAGQADADDDDSGWRSPKPRHGWSVT
jgi:hypothetical protein